MKKGKRFLGLLIFLATFAAGTAIVMLLWNWLIPTVIGWTVIGYWQAAGLVLLCRILFGGGHGWHGRRRHGHGHGKHGHWHHHWHDMRGCDRDKMRDEVRNMNPDQRREYIRRQMFGNHAEKPEGMENGGR